MQTGSTSPVWPIAKNILPCEEDFRVAPVVFLGTSRVSGLWESTSDSVCELCACSSSSDSRSRVVITYYNVKYQYLHKSSKNITSY